MAIENIDGLSDGAIEQRALEVLKRADAKHRQASNDSEQLFKADYRAAYTLLVGSNVLDRRGAIQKQFLEEGTEGEICARHAMGRMLRRLANSHLDAELTTILILLAGHFDGKVGYQTVPRIGPNKWAVAELASERRLQFAPLPAEAHWWISLGWVKKALLKVRSFFPW
jgi:hypothetical protein